MAHAAGVQLHRLHAGLLDLERVHVALEVRLDDAERLHAAAAQLLDDGEQDGGLAGARARHHVHEERAVLGPRGAEGVGGLVVGGQDVPLHFDNALAVHRGLLRLRPTPSARHVRFSS
jgi:hypothetical protein